MNNCCYNCENLECRKNYEYPYRCLKHKAERLSEKELDQIVRKCWAGEVCKDYERKWIEMKVEE
jgi:hypothetical protein